MIFNVYSKSAVTNRIIKIITCFLIFCLPFDTIRLVKTSYFPLSIIPLVALLIVLLPKIFQFKISRASFFYLFFYIISILSSAVIHTINSYSFSFFLDYFVTLSVGFALFLCLDIVFSSARKKENLKRWVFTLLANAYTIPIFITLIDLFSVNHLLPLSISQFIHSLFGGGQPSRVCGTTGESAWVCMHMFFSFFSFFFLFKEGKNKKFNSFMMIVIALIVLFSFSMFGYVVLCLFLLFFWILSLKVHFSAPKLILPIVFFVAGLIVVKLIQGIDSDAYFVVRFKHLSLNYLLNNDASVFTRIINPTIAILVFLSHPIVGAGGGTYPLLYENYIKKYFSFGLSIYGGQNEIVTEIASLSANSKCLYARLLGESGFLSIFYYSFLISVVKKVRKDHLLLCWCAMMLIVMFQFDSMCYFPFIFCLAVCNNYRQKEKINEILHRNCKLQ